MMIPISSRCHYPTATTTSLFDTPEQEEPISSANELFESQRWKDMIKKDLDQLPIFCCANEEGVPLAYRIEMKDADQNDVAYEVPLMFCDVEDALAERDKARKTSGLGDKIDIVPFPGGKAFEMWATDKAVIVPNKEILVKAGAPLTVNPIGQQVPLFACMEIMQETKDGTGVLPLFMSPDEAYAAVKEAVGTDGGSANDLEVVSLSLERAVQMLASVGEEAPAFQFIPPKKSIKYIEEYLSSNN